MLPHPLATLTLPVIFGPNITGQFQGGDHLETLASGAFGYAKESTSTLGGGAYKLDIGDFKASRSSSVYGGYSGVQPPSIAMLPCIKI